MIRTKRRFLYTMMIMVIMFIIYMMIIKGNSVTFDKAIVNIVENLQCPVLTSEISDDNYADFSCMNTESIDLIKHWDFNDKIIELYQGNNHGLLAIVRKDDRVYCAQYVNDESLYHETYISEDTYTYTIVSSASGIYVKTVIAFFSDGKNISYIFWDPVSHEPFSVFVSENESILALVNEQNTNGHF